MTGSSWWHCLWVPFTITFWLCIRSIWLFLWDSSVCFHRGSFSRNHFRFNFVLFSETFTPSCFCCYCCCCCFPEIMGLWNCLLGFRQSLSSRECKPHDFYLGITKWIKMDLVTIHIFKWRKYLYDTAFTLLTSNLYFNW